MCVFVVCSVGIPFYSKFFCFYNFFGELIFLFWQCSIHTDRLSNVVLYSWPGLYLSYFFLLFFVEPCSTNNRFLYFLAIHWYQLGKRVMLWILSKRDSVINWKHLLQMRLRLDRRCLEEAFLLSASLEVIEQCNLWDKLPSLPCDRNEMVKLVADPFWTSDHLKTNLIKFTFVSSLVAIFKGLSYTLSWLHLK